MAMTLAEYLRIFSNIKRHELELIMADILKKDRLWVMTHLEYQPSAWQERKMNDYFHQLTIGVPLAYIIGYKRFYDADFFVNKHVLIPRQETEELIERVVETIKEHTRSIKIADIGTGSGCIGISLALQVPKHHYFLLDKSKRALAVAQKNVATLLPKFKNISLYGGNLLAPLKNDLPDLIIANLPYLSEAIYQDSDIQVRTFEPQLALYGGADGLDLYRQLLKQIGSYYPAGFYPEMWWEISPEQYELLLAGAVDIPKVYHVQFYRDLSDRWRFVRLLP